MTTCQSVGGKSISALCFSRARAQAFEVILYGGQRLLEARLYSTTLVRRWNWSTVNPANDAPAPPVGSVWPGRATRCRPAARVRRLPD